MITAREFVREYLFKVLLILIVVEIGVFAYLQNRNHKPIAENDFIEVYAHQQVEFNALRNDTDKEEAELSIAEITQPIHGEVSQVEKGLIYKP